MSHSKASRPQKTQPLSLVKCDSASEPLFNLFIFIGGRASEVDGLSRYESGRLAAVVVKDVQTPHTSPGIDAFGGSLLNTIEIRTRSLFWAQRRKKGPRKNSGRGAVFLGGLIAKNPSAGASL